jgi:hypothetical protein
MRDVQGTIARSRSLRAGIGCLVTVLALVLGPLETATAQEQAAVGRLLQSLGLDIPPGPVSHSDELRVLTYDEQASPVTARVHVNVGENRVVMLPDGQLVVRSLADSPPTQRPFEPATKEGIARDLTTQSLRGFRKKETLHYVYLYNSSEGFVEITSRILETMYGGVVKYAQAQEIEVQPPETPLVAVIFRTGDEFRKYSKMPEGVLAYYDVLTNRIVMYEESPFWKIKPVLAVQQSLATIAHEGAHQILYNIGVQQRLAGWPMWLNEGLAEFFAPTTTDRRLKWKGAGHVNDMRMFELDQWLKSRSADDINGQFVAQTVGAARLTSTGYAAAWALTHYLAKNHRTDFHSIVRRYSGLRPLEGGGRVVPPGVIPGNVGVFKEYFGDDLADLERRMFLHLKNLPYVDPFKDLPHWVVLISVPEGQRVKREADVFQTPEQAKQWRREVIRQAPEQQRDAIQSAVREFPNRILAENYARQWLQGG